MVSGKEISVAIADRDRSFRVRLSRLIAGQPGMRVAAELGSGKKAVMLAAGQPPDVLFLDMKLPDMTGFEVLAEIGNTRAQVITLVDVPDAHELARALLLGASGSVERSAAAAIFLKSIQTVLTGELWFRREVTGALLDFAADDGRARRPGSDLSRDLTRREIDILKGVADGMPNKEIASRLGISEFTVKHHLSHVFSKLGVSNRVELALLAAKYDL